MDISPYQGVYINLDRSPERRRDLEAQLRAHGIFDRYVRLAATDGARVSAPRSNLKPGEIGCFHSHYRALLQAAASSSPVHVLEDDVIVSEHLQSFAQKASTSRLFDGFDILFTDTYVHANPFTLRFLKEGMDAALDANGRPRADFNVRLFGLANMELTCTTSYFVAPNAIGRVISVLKAELDVGPRMPLDYCYRAAADTGVLKIACTMPFLTTIHLESITGSTITTPDRRGAGFDYALQSLLRYSFFVGRDLQGYAARYFHSMVDPDEERDPHQKFLSAVLSAILAGAKP